MEVIPLPSMSGEEGMWGGIATNADNTLFAYVDRNRHCVHIRRINAAGKRASDAVVFGTPDRCDNTKRALNHPQFACFARRRGVDTLLVCDSKNNRVVEITVGGVFKRAIALTKGSHAYGVAYCGQHDAVAVSLAEHDAVVLLRYASAAVIARIGFPTPKGPLPYRFVGMGALDGQLNRPQGLRFTADGVYLLVADHHNDRVCKFDAVTGAFIAHVVHHDITYPTDVLPCEDGSIMVATGEGAMYEADGRRYVRAMSGGVQTTTGSVVQVGVDGVVSHRVIIEAGGFVPHSLAYFEVLDGVVAWECNGSGRVVLLRQHNAWSSSLRCAWLSACIVV
jgi:hypothetical protein